LFYRLQHFRSVKSSEDGIQGPLLIMQPKISNNSWDINGAATGRKVAVHERIEGPSGKSFLWKDLNGKSGLPEGVNLKDLALYAIERADTTKPVVIVEGEKCADSLLDLDINAVGTVCGAASIPGDDALSPLLSFPKVILWADNDNTGKSHMEKIANKLLHLGTSSVKQVVWLNAPEKGDCVDAIEAGVDVHRLIQEARQYSPSATISEGKGPQEFQGVRFHKASELFDEEFKPTEYVCKPWVVKGSITEISGKIKSAGKTTFVTHLCAALLKGESFLGEPTTSRCVIYLTEQPWNSFTMALQRAGLSQQENMDIVFWNEAYNRSWDSLMSQVTTRALALDALVVVDTLSRFTSIQGDGENTTGEALTAMKPLELAAAQGIPIIIVRHERKSGGQVGDSSRGSSAFGGAVDSLVSISRGDGNTDPNVRRISAISRFDGVPQELYIQLTEDGYIPLGSSGAVAESKATQLILENSPEKQYEAMSLDDYVKRVDTLKKTTTNKVLRTLVKEGKLKCVGKGNKSNAYRYWKA